MARKRGDIEMSEKPFQDQGSVFHCYGCGADSVNTAIAHHYRAEGRPIGTKPLIRVVTANLNVTYLKAVDISKPVNLRARLVKNEGRKSWIETTLSSEGKICAEGKVLAVRTCPPEARVV